jgi:hypothetical protein
MCTHPPKRSVAGCMQAALGRSRLGRDGGRLVRAAAEPSEAAARAGGEEGEPGDERRAEQDEAHGHHPQLLVRRVERHRPPHQHAGARQPHARDACRRRAARPRHAVPLRSSLRGAAHLQRDVLVLLLPPRAAAGRLRLTLRH